MFPPNLKIDAMYRGDDLLLGPDGPKEMDEDELLDAPVCALFFFFRNNETVPFFRFSPSDSLTVSFIRFFECFVSD